MKNLILLTLSIFTLFSCEKDSENLPAPKNLLKENGLIYGSVPEGNTMYLYEDGVR